MNYSCVKIETFSQAKKYAKVNNQHVLWAFTHKSTGYGSLDILFQSAFSVYVLLRDDYRYVLRPKHIKFNKIYKQISDNTYTGFENYDDRLDSYGLSMIAVLVDNNTNEIFSTMTRYANNFLFDRNKPADTKNRKRLEVPVKMVNQLLGCNWKDVLFEGDYKTVNDKKSAILQELKDALDYYKHTLIDIPKEFKFADLKHNPNSRWHELPLYRLSDNIIGKYYQYYTFVDKDLNLFSDTLLFEKTNHLESFYDFGGKKYAIYKWKNKYHLIDEDANILNEYGFTDIIWGNFVDDIKNGYVMVQHIDKAGNKFYNVMDTDGFLMYEKWFSQHRHISNFGVSYKNLYDKNGNMLVKYPDDHLNIIDMHENALFVDDDITDMFTLDNCAYHLNYNLDDCKQGYEYRYYRYAVCSKYSAGKGSRVQNIFDVEKKRFVLKDWDSYYFDAFTFMNSPAENCIGVFKLSPNNTKQFDYFINLDTCEKFDANNNFYV